MGVRHHLHTNDQIANFLDIVNQGRLAGKQLTVEFVTDNTRTPTQNNALHLYCERLADALNDAGYERVITSPILKEPLSVPWSKDSVKADIWHRVQLALTDEPHSSKLTKAQVSQIFEVIHRHLAESFDLSVDWPHREVQDGSG